MGQTIGTSVLFGDTGGFWENKESLEWRGGAFCTICLRVKLWHLNLFSALRQSGTHMLEGSHRISTFPLENWDDRQERRNGSLDSVFLLIIPKNSTLHQPQCLGVEGGGVGAENLAG